MGEQRTSIRYCWNISGRSLMFAQLRLNVSVRVFFFLHVRVCVCGGGGGRAGE